MTQDSQVLDPYAVVLADLRAQRDRIDVAIHALEQLRGGSAAAAPATPAPESPTVPDSGPGAFLGMTVVEATKALLSSRRVAMPNADIVRALEQGGLVMNSVDKLNTVNSILTRRFNTHGDLVRVRRGVWGLQSWYGSRNFKAKTKAQDALDGIDPEVSDDLPADLPPPSGARPAPTPIPMPSPIPWPRGPVVQQGVVPEDNPWAPIDKPGP